MTEEKDWHNIGRMRAAIIAGNFKKGADFKAR